MSKIVCSGCGERHDFMDVHEENKSGSVTHDCRCGYSLVTGKLGSYAGAITTGECLLCSGVKARERSHDEFMQTSGNEFVAAMDGLIE